MEIGKPIWYSTKHCPDCGQCFPIFRFCPACGFLTLQCESSLNLFVDPKKLEAGVADVSFCPKCRIVSDEDFEDASDIQLIEAGFTVADYK